MACFADIDVSQGSVAIYARCGGIFDIHLTANLPGNLPAKNFLNRLKIDRIMVISLWPRFWPTLYVVGRKITKVVVVSGSRGLQKTELQDLQLSVVM